MKISILLAFFVLSCAPERRTPCEIEAKIVEKLDLISDTKIGIVQKVQTYFVQKNEETGEKEMVFETVNLPQDSIPLNNYRLSDGTIKPFDADIYGIGDIVCSKWRE